MSTPNPHLADRPAEAHRPPDAFRWLPIRTLGPRHREAIRAHLLAMDAESRHLRFGYPANDSHISRYVDRLDFENDEVFGVFNRRLELIGMAHVAYIGADSTHPAIAEFGVSVLGKVRGRGIGGRLFELACLHARNRGIDTMMVHALTENTAMLKIARAAGALLERDGPDSTARLKLPPDGLGTRLTELVEQQAALVDYELKHQGLNIARLQRTLKRLIPSQTGLIARE